MDKNNHIEWTRDQLNAEIDTVRELLEIPCSNVERDERLERRLGSAVFELWARSAENRPQPAAELA